MIGLARLNGLNVGYLTRDVTSIAKISPLTGILSTLGLLVWAASCATWYCCRVIAVYRHDATMRLFATASLLLTGWMVLDDAFLFHESLVPNKLHVPEKAVMLLLVAAASGYAYRFRDLLRPFIFPLAFAVLPLGLSILVDQFDHILETRIGDWEYLLEDGLKWLGIVGWFGFALLNFRSLLIGKPG